MKRIQKQVNWLDHNGPIILLVLATATFIAVWGFKFDFYKTLLSARFDGFVLSLFAFAIAVIAEGARFSLVIATVSDFGKSNHIGGWLGLSASIGFMAFDLYESQYIAALYEGSEVLIRTMLKFLVVAGFIIELRLVLTLLDNFQAWKSQKKSRKEIPNGGVRSGFPRREFEEFDA